MAQINFFKGDHSRFFDVETGDWKSGFEDAICFDITQEEIWVNGVSFGTSKDLKTFISEGQIVTGVAQDGFKLTFSFAEGDDVVVDFSATASATNNGLMSSDDKKNLDKLSELLDADDDSGFKIATSSANGLMSAAHVSLLELLSGTGGGEGEEDPSIIVKVANLEGDVVNIKGDIVSIKEDIGEWSSTTESIAQAIGGLNDSVSGVDGRVEALEEQIQGLSGAMHFKGIVESDPTGEDFSVDEYADGDVVLYGDKEYVFSNGAFVELGDVSAEGERLTKLEADVKALQEDDTDAKAIAALALRVTANEENITAVTTQAGENEEAIAQLAERVKGLEDSTEDAEAIEALAKKIGGDFSEENTVADAIASLVSRMDAVDTAETGSIALLAARVSDLESDNTDAEAIEALAERVQALEDDTTLEDHEGRITTIEGQLVWQ